MPFANDPKHTPAGYGDPSERDPEAVHADIGQGCTTEHLARHHAFPG